jgi:PAS domain S-box-containing protein
MAADGKARDLAPGVSASGVVGDGARVNRAIPAELLRAAQQAVIATDTDRRIVFWNKAAEKLYGWTAEEVLGLDILEVTPLEPEPARRVLEPVEHGGAWAGEFLLRRKNGEAFPAFVTISPLHDEEGRAAGVLGLSFDLSGRQGDPKNATRASQVAQASSSRASSEPHSRLIPRARALPAQLGVALGLVAAATLGRLGLGLIDPAIAPFSLYFPAILLAALLGGIRAGAAATVLSVAVAWRLFLEPATGMTPFGSTALINVALFVGVGAAIVAVAGYVGTLIERLGQSQGALAERNLYYDTLFQTMSEGFAVCEAIRDDRGGLSDYVVLEMNPALQRMLGVGPEAVGGKLSDADGDQTAWLALCDQVLKTGTPQVSEYHNPTTGLWHEIHVNRVTQTRMAQLFFDVTERKASQTRQAELFDELNHRVKNNLGIVSAILSMQARAGDDRLRVELMKAVDRVQSIAAVHESLYAGRRTGEVDFGVYLESLCQSLSKSLLADDRIQLVVDAQSAPIAADHAVPLGMVVNELVTNAIKYAYPAPERGLISVRFQTTRDGALLSVADSGRGLPEDFESKAGGLGVRLLRSMVQQVGGSLTVRRHPGATFEIALPKRGAQ